MQLLRRREDDDIQTRISDIDEEIRNLAVKARTKIKLVASMDSQLYGPTEKEAKEQAEGEATLKKLIWRNPVMRATLTAEYEASHPRRREDTRALLLEGCYEARRAEVFAHTGLEEGLDFQAQMKNLRRPKKIGVN